MTCECSDAHCPACHGRCRRHNVRPFTNLTVDSKYPIYLCHGCGEDALASGIFTEGLPVTNAEYVEYQGLEEQSILEWF